MKYTPKNKKELKELVDNLDINLGDIDTSNITEMYYLFHKTNRIDFSGIENWDVSNVEYMYGMFANSQFNGDISNWDVSKAYNSNGIRFMFYDTYIPENHKPKLLQKF